MSVNEKLEEMAELEGELIASDDPKEKAAIQRQIDQLEDEAQAEIGRQNEIITRRQYVEDNGEG